MIRDTMPVLAFSAALLLCLSATTASAAEQTQVKVDRYGQRAGLEFPGKVTSDEELKSDAVRQLAEMDAFKPDPKLDRYGGLSGSGAEYKLERTGFFHTTQIGDRHVLVTPEGNVFFHLAVCGIARTDDDTLVKGREEIYEWLPPTNGPLAAAWREKPGSGVVSFYVANWIRKFDLPYSLNEWSAQVVQRLRSWGFNSAGAFSSNTDAMKSANFATVSFLPLGAGGGVQVLPDKIGASGLLDPFAPGTEEALDKRFAGGVAARANDPLLIGYFLGNEQHFEILPRLLPTYPASKVAAKARLIQLLQEKYKTIDAFNAAWAPEKPFTSFDDVGEASLVIRTDAANADMAAFYELYLDSYYSLVRRVFKKHDPNHLLIGSRLTPGTANNKTAVTIGGRYVDVVSINYYAYAIDKPFLDRVYEWSGGKPIIFSEWHYSAGGRGLQTRMEVKSDHERGLAYRNYVEQSAALPYVVGTQWFIYTDQALTGRFFEGLHGEGNNIGFVDVADRPYMGLVEGAKAAHSSIYEVMLGKQEPFAFKDPRFDGSLAKNSGKTLSIPRALPGMKLDGTTSNWPGRPAEPIESSRIVLGRPNLDLRGDFRVCWDDTNLYFHILVQDPTPLQNTKQGSGVWNGDGVELFIGARSLEQTGNMIYSDRQVLIGASEKPVIHIVEHAADSESCQLVLVRNVSGDGYAVQATIPWSALGIEPKADLEMLFDVAVNNSDDGDMRVQQLAWNGSSQNSKDRSAWGRARLTDN